MCDEICAQIVDGKSVRALCALAGMPDPATVFRWLVKHEDFRDQYVRARGERATARFEKMDDVIQDMRNNVIDHRQARVEIETIKWQLGREDAAKYGDRIIHAGDKDAPLHPEGIDDADRAAMARFMSQYGDRITDIKPAQNKQQKESNYDDLC